MTFRISSLCSTVCCVSKLLCTTAKVHHMHFQLGLITIYNMQASPHGWRTFLCEAGPYHVTVVVFACWLSKFSCLCWSSTSSPHSFFESWSLCFLYLLLCHLNTWLPYSYNNRAKHRNIPPQILACLLPACLMLYLFSGTLLCLFIYTFWALRMKWGCPRIPKLKNALRAL